MAYLLNTRYEFVGGSENRKGLDGGRSGRVATVVPYPTSRRQ